MFCKPEGGAQGLGLTQAEALLGSENAGLCCLQAQPASQIMCNMSSILVQPLSCPDLPEEENSMFILVGGFVVLFGLFFLPCFGVFGFGLVWFWF